MESNIIIRQYKKEDVKSMVPIWNQVVEEGVAFPQLETLSTAGGRRFFEGQSYCGVAEDETGRIVGMYILHPNNIGRCGHISNASYAVDRNCRGRHVGELLVRDCIRQAGELGFRILQFNAVVESNTAANNLYEKLGFTKAGTIPGGFRMDDGSYEDIFIYYIKTGRGMKGDGPERTSSRSYSGIYSESTQVECKDAGNVLSVKSVLDKVHNVRGNIREDRECTYLLFEPRNDDCTISAAIRLKSVDAGTDKQGIAIGQFDAVEGMPMHCDVLHGQKNCVFQHTFSTASGMGANGNPKSAAIDKDSFTGTTYRMMYSKCNNIATLQVWDAMGRKLILEDDNTFDLTQTYETLQSGRSVRYGIALAGVEADIAGLTLKDASGSVIYNQDDYYKPDCEPPAVTKITKAGESSDRRRIELGWEAETCDGYCEYDVEVSYNNEAYINVGTAATTAFAYTPENSGDYTFRVYGRIGNEVNKSSYAQSEAVHYIRPLDDASLTAIGSADGIDISLKLTDDAYEWKVFRADTCNVCGDNDVLMGTFTGKDAKKAADGESVVSFTDKSCGYDPLYYYVISYSEDNCSNPGEPQQALRISNRAEAVYAVNDMQVEMVVDDKSNDTLGAHYFYITGHYNTDGRYKVLVNGRDAAEALDGFTHGERDCEGCISCGAGESIRIEGYPAKGFNKIEVIFESVTGSRSRKVFNFLCMPYYNCVVDASYKGAQGALDASGIPQYSRISDALVHGMPGDGDVIFVKNGVYRERVVVERADVSIIGEDAKKTRIEFNACVADGTAAGMRDRNAMLVEYTATGFSMCNISIENTYPYADGTDQQADALAILADNVSVTNITLLGYQDTLFVDAADKDDFSPDITTHQHFSCCHIEGNVDFIYGCGAAIFDDCDIIGRYTPYKADGCFTAPRTHADAEYGFIFRNCRFYADDRIETKAYRLARPWGRDAAAFFINCYMSDVVCDNGYSDMSGNSYKNARFAEYGSVGEGMAVNNDRPLLRRSQAEHCMEII